MNINISTLYDCWYKDIIPHFPGEYREIWIEDFDVLGSFYTRVYFEA